MSHPKAHHFVPQLLLRAFADDDGWLHWARVGQPDPVIRRTRPAEIFVSNHLYSIIEPDGTRDVEIERELGRLEDAAASVIAKMVTAARAGHPPALTAQEKAIWYAFFLIQWRRTPETQQAVASDAERSAMLDELLAEIRERFPERAAEVEALETDAARARMLRNVKASGLRYLSENVTAVLEKRGIAILRIRRPNKRFIIGSRPVVKFTINGQSDLNDPIVEMWLPVSSDVAIGVGAGDGGIGLHFLDYPAPIRQLNNAVAGQSAMIAGASPDLVRSLARANRAVGG